MKNVFKRDGFTLIEMLIAMSIFSVVIMIAGKSFETIIAYSSRLVKSEESNIEGLIGFEMLRHDLSSAGFGLPDLYDPNNWTPRFNEAVVVPASNYNDGKGTTVDANVPRAFAGGNDLVNSATTDSGGLAYNIIGGTDYLALKGSSLGNTIASQKWTYVLYSSNGKPPNSWTSNSENIPSGSWVIMLKKVFSASGFNSQLVVDSVQVQNDPNYFSTTYQPGGYTANFRPPALNDIHYIYGITTDGSSNYPRMPFNRADYFVARPPDANVPSICSKAKDGDDKSLVGTFYRATINHGSTNPGKLTYTPIMDCVADFQVVLGWDVNGDGALDTWSSLPNAAGDIVAVSGTGSLAEVKALLNADGIRNHLKLFKVYILAQLGKRDSNYTSPATINMGDTPSLTRAYQIPANSEMLNYRWKLYQIVARPKNLAVNQ